MLTYHYLLMFQTDFLRNSVIEELFRERTHYYLNQKKRRDFWVLMTPLFFDQKDLQLLKETFYYKNLENQASILKKTSDGYKNFLTDSINYSVAIVSTNEEFINWIALRLGEFEELKSSSLVSRPNILVSNGIRGKKSYSILQTSQKVDPNAFILFPYTSISDSTDLRDVMYTYMSKAKDSRILKKSVKI